jgi:hypothetical protein
MSNLSPIAQNSRRDEDEDLLGVPRMFPKQLAPRVNASLDALSIGAQGGN